MSLRGKHLFITTVVLPLVGLISAIALFTAYGISFLEIGLLVSFYLLGAFGVEVGFHRYFAHKAFKTSPKVAYLLGVLGSLNFYGTALGWAGSHRAHHKWVDTDKDPHSPKTGIFHAWIGWFFTSEHIDVSGWRKISSDLFKDPIVRRLRDEYIIWGCLGLILPALITAFVTWSVYGLLSGFVYCGLFRMFLVSHNVYLTNILGHSLWWGSRPYETEGTSVNNALLAIPSLGLSWHNNHHAQPSAAVLNHKWYQLDILGLPIYLMDKLGIIWDVKYPKQCQ